jgi:hypothetical protein
MAGYDFTKVSLDNRIGRAVITLQAAFDEVEQIELLLQDSSRASDTILLGLGYGQGEINTIRAAFAALSALDRIGHAQADQPAANDFWWDAKNLTGVQGRF